MKPVLQTRLGTKGAHTGDCFAACIASLLEVPLSQVPHESSWSRQWERLTEWLGERGLMLLEVKYGADNLGLHIKAGPSPRGLNHAVVADGDRIVHDPHPEGGGIKEHKSAWAFALKDPALLAAVERGERLAEAKLPEAAAGVLRYLQEFITASLSTQLDECALTEIAHEAQVAADVLEEAFGSWDAALAAYAAKEGE